MIFSMLNVVDAWNEISWEDAIPFTLVLIGLYWVKVRLGGACSTCAMSSMTLKQGIEKKLMMEIPDVKGVVQVL